MTRSDLSGEWGSWRVEDPPLLVEYSRSAMETIRSAAMEGLYKLAKGGLEVGGVLLGERTGDGVRILDSRPMACEHAFGPSFVLSEADEGELRRQLAAFSEAPELRGLTVVGWYHSHTRSQICLTDRDLEVFDRYFPDVWQVSLVLQPHRSRPVRAGFFCRESGRTLRRDASYREFELEPVRKAPAPTAAPVPQVPPPSPAEPAVPALTRRRAGPGFWLLFALAWCVAAVSLAFALRGYWLPKPAAPAESVAPPPDPAVLELTRRHDELAAEVERLRAEVDRLAKEDLLVRGGKGAPQKSVK